MDREAEFRRLYGEHRPAVHAYFVGRTADPGAAADLMQEVFMRVWQRLPEVTGRPADAQRAWIFTVARNLAIDTYRRERSRAGAEQALAGEPAPVQPSATAAVLAAERAAVVGAAIRKLPHEQRTTLTMSAAGDMTSADIAAALGVPAGTVRYRLSLARRALADALACYDQPPATSDQRLIRQRLRCGPPSPATSHHQPPSHQPPSHPATYACGATMSLDDALADWAATVRLPPATAEDIFQAIIATPAPVAVARPVLSSPGLSAAWWRRYTSDFTTRMVASTRPARWAA